LASLSANAIKPIVPHLVPVPLSKDQTLHQPGQPVEQVYFLEECICSMVVSISPHPHRFRVNRLGAFVLPHPADHTPDNSFRSFAD
jgi:hypothetical protein